MWYYVIVYYITLQYNRIEPNECNKHNELKERSVALKWISKRKAERGNQKRQLFVPGPPDNSPTTSAFRQLSVSFPSAFRLLSVSFPSAFRQLFVLPFFASLFRAHWKSKSGRPGGVHVHTHLALLVVRHVRCCVWPNHVCGILCCVYIYNMHVYVISLYIYIYILCMYILYACIWYMTIYIIWYMLFMHVYTYIYIYIYIHTYVVRGKRQTSGSPLTSSGQAIAGGLLLWRRRGLEGGLQRKGKCS